jgi:hypothetical protein
MSTHVRITALTGALLSTIFAATADNCGQRCFQCAEGMDLGQIAGTIAHPLFFIDEPSADRNPAGGPGRARCPFHRG